jgi:hypothetical protein
MDECTRYSGKLKGTQEKERESNGMKEGKTKEGKKEKEKMKRTESRKEENKSGLVPSVPQARFVGVVMWGSCAHGQRLSAGQRVTETQ